MRHLRVWFAAAPPGGPPEQPRRLLRAGLGPGTVERESGKSRGRADRRGLLLLPRLLGAPTPSFGEGKRDGLSRARTKSGTSIALAVHLISRQARRECSKH